MFSFNILQAETKPAALLSFCYEDWFHVTTSKIAISPKANVHIICTTELKVRHT